MVGTVRSDGIAVGSPPGSPPPDSATELGQPWDTLTVAELKTWAEEHDVDLAGADRKADIITALVAATGSPGIPTGGR